jgi:hypothetical protein
MEAKLQITVPFGFTHDMINIVNKGKENGAATVCNGYRSGKIVPKFEQHPFIFVCELP